jgi:ribonuclease HI
VKAKKKYYVVWKGLKTGIFTKWDDCKKQVEGFNGAQYMGFETQAEAELAFSKGYAAYAGQKGKKPELTDEVKKQYGIPLKEAIAVDAAFNGKEMEYKGVYVKSGKEIFHFGPFKGGSNNIGEFLAIVHCMALMSQKNANLPIYSDSMNAISWVKQKMCKTKVDLTQNSELEDLINRAEKWLQTTDTSKFKVLKWHTNAWGETPADFGRK